MSHLLSADYLFNGQMPKRRLGRRSLAVNNTTNNTTNTTLNGTMNNTSHIPRKSRFMSPSDAHRKSMLMSASDVSQKSIRINEPTCASTPLPDHSKNKENIFLSSIKPVLPSSPKSSRKVPYQRRLGRRSMAATKTAQLDESALNDSLNRMRSINATLKATDPKTPTRTAFTQPPASGGGLSLFGQLDFLKRYLPVSVVPSTAPQVNVQPPSPVKSISDEFLRKSIINSSPTSVRSASHGMLSQREIQSPARSRLNYDDSFKRGTSATHTGPGAQSESPLKNAVPTRGDAKYGSLLKNIKPQYESIIETSESPTLTLELPAENASDSVTLMEDKEDVTLLKRSLSGISEVEMNDADFGSFLKDEEKDKARENEMAAGDAGMNDPREDLNKTFELEEEKSFLFKTPVALKFVTRAAYKTPNTSVFKRFHLNNDENDSFVENERTIMLQFQGKEENSLNNVMVDVESQNEANVDMSSVVNNGVSEMANALCDVNGGPTSILENDSAVNDEAAPSSEARPTCEAPQQCGVSSTVRETAEEFLMTQRSQLEQFVSRQHQQLMDFIAEQNEAYRTFLASQRDENAAIEQRRT